MTFTTDTNQGIINDPNTKQALEAFRGFDPDTKLALLWFGYLDLKDQLRPNPTAPTEAVGEALFDQICALPREQQLQAQRDIVNCAGTDICRGYSSLSSSGKLYLWLRLAQGMENGTIVPMPSDYQLPGETDRFVQQVKALGFEQRINFMRSAVVEMGSNPIQHN